jgi:hypothetical protein
MKIQRPLSGIVILLASLALAPAAVAQDAPPNDGAPPYAPDYAPEPVPPAPVDAVQQDRALFNQLVRQMRRINRETDSAMDAAVAEARTQDGKANLETKARLLSLRDQRDRIYSRLLVLSMRHGWAIPDLDPDEKADASRREAEDSVFGSVDELVKRRFAAEAQAIAIATQLPVVSLPGKRK